MFSAPKTLSGGSSLLIQACASRRKERHRPKRRLAAGLNTPKRGRECTAYCIIIVGVFLSYLSNTGIIYTTHDYTDDKEKV